MRVAAAVLLAPLFQVLLVNRVPWPGGVAPDLTMPVALAIGRARGPVAGAVAGFALGLVLDLVPPAAPPLGHSALVLCLLGYLGGRLKPAYALVAGVVGGYALTLGLASLLVGADAVWPVARQVLLAGVPYTLILALPVWIVLHASSAAGVARPVRLAAGRPAGAALGRAGPLRRVLRGGGYRVAHQARRHPARAWGDRR